MTDGFVPHAAHWGAFAARVAGGRVDVRPDPLDPSPSPILGNFADVLSTRTRVRVPAVRAGWLENGPGSDPRRGDDSYVELGWDETLRLLSGELDRVRREHGNSAIYGGSYGWSSAGRFHHAQSQVHRFLNCIGGYVRSVNSYSAGAAEVVLPRVLAPQRTASRNGVMWRDIVEHGRLVVAFGGLPLKNSQIDGGGSGPHLVGQLIEQAHDAGVEFVCVGPLRDDMPPGARATWIPVRPGTDTALMLAIAHVLFTEDRVDVATVSSVAVGLEELRAYVLGQADDLPKSPQWAEPITGVEAGRIRELARSMADGPCLITVSQALQRSEYGEQPVWMAVALATLLGEIGLPGRGFCYGLGSMAGVGMGRGDTSLPTLQQGRNPVAEFIPVARIADMLLKPGGGCDYDGQWVAYPDIRLVYWAGGNPFHHHQDLSRLAAAFARPETVVVHEPFWTATARHADFVLPVTTTLERSDLAAAPHDPRILAMHPVAEPVGDSRSDYAIFADLAERLGVGAEFTEGRNELEWLRHLYEETRRDLERQGWAIAEFEEFWRAGSVELPPYDGTPGPVELFRADPEGHPLETESGRIQLYSERIAGYGYADCLGHPAWFEPREWHGADLATSYPLVLVANQPARRLHSQLDFGPHSRDGKRNGHEIARMNPDDAVANGIEDGDVVRIHNDRGACLAAVETTEDVMPGVIQLSTGAWYAPETIDGVLTCVHGNPNTVTADRGTSCLAQGSIGQHALVRVDPFTGRLPQRDPHAPPPVRSQNS